MADLWISPCFPAPGVLGSVLGWWPRPTSHISLGGTLLPLGWGFSPWRKLWSFWLGSDPGPGGPCSNPVPEDFYTYRVYWRVKGISTDPKRLILLAPDLMWHDSLRSSLAPILLFLGCGSGQLHSSQSESIRLAGHSMFICKSPSLKAQSKLPKQHSGCSPPKLPKPQGVELWFTWRSWQKWRSNAEPRTQWTASHFPETEQNGKNGKTVDKTHEDLLSSSC